MQIEEYRTRLERFHAALNRQIYLHYSGQRGDLDLASVYSDYSDLYSLETILDIKSAMEQVGDSFPSKHKSLGKIHAFALDQHLDASACGLTREIAEFEASRRFQFGESDISFFQIPRCIANETDISTRRRLNNFRLEVFSQSNTLREARLGALQAAAKKAGYRDYLSALAQVSGIDFPALSKSVDAVLEVTQDVFMERLHQELGTTFNVQLQDILRCDLLRWIRLCEPPEGFSFAGLQTALRSTVTELGVEPEHPSAIVFDLENRPMKQLRACCVPIRVPFEIKVVLTSGDGHDNCAALMHEAGHAHHLAWTSAGLPAEDRLCGDPGVSEIYAFLLESLTCDRNWLRLYFEGVPSESLLRSVGLYRLYQVRSQIGRLSYETRLYSEGGLEEAAGAYAEIMRRCTGIAHEPESCLEEAGSAMGAAAYLRGWMASAMLAEHLRSRFGREWFRRKQAGAFLKELWETGGLYRVEELCREIGLGDIDVQVLLDELRGGLNP